MNPKSRPRKTRVTLAIWDKCRDLYERGEGLANLSRLMSISKSAIQRRIQTHGWERLEGPKARDFEHSKSREAEKEGADGRSGGALSDTSKSRRNSLSVKGFVDVGQIFDRLKHLEDAPPEIYQLGAVKVLQDMVSQGFTQIKAPETWQELKTAFELWRKASGLDVVKKDLTGPGLLRPLRTLNRAAPVVATIAAPGSPMEAAAGVPADEDDGLGSEP